ncbi:hypothetical protein L596_006913 [Steinernema carpocapsae]|uniref:Uncharacterized protein n=1 Tax=Steinernema carpocapsae TaxID=34508 RepID=A0A4U5P822_STECR|nr:hypothetical protein L596_006913 [Steinernema carpocapsae]
MPQASDPAAAAQILLIFATSAPHSPLTRVPFTPVNLVPEHLPSFGITCFSIFGINGAKRGIASFCFKMCFKESCERFESGFAQIGAIWITMRKSSTESRDTESVICCFIAATRDVMSLTRPLRRSTSARSSTFSSSASF